MPAPLLLALALCALQLCPAVLAGPQHQRFGPGSGWPTRLSRVYNFEWNNCGPSDPARVKSLNVIPDPVCIPGDVTISASGTTTIAIEAPLKGNVTLEKKIGNMWIKIPCVDELGSCMYEDICAKLDSLMPPGKPCPEPLHTCALPCHCPFKAGTYYLPPSDIYIPNLDLPSFLTNGDYRMKSELSNCDQKIACMNVKFSLHSANWWFWW